MLRTFGKIAGQFKRWVHADGGVAAVEFAIVMPLLLTLYLGSVEASRALTFDRRITFAASTLGDLVSQSRNSITTTEISEYFKAAELTLQPYNSTGLGLIVSSVYVDASGNGTIKWSRGKNATAHTVDAAYILPSQFTNITLERTVIVAEASYSYQPITSYIFNSNIGLYKEYFYVPRFGDAITCSGC